MGGRRRRGKSRYPTASAPSVAAERRRHLLRLRAAFRDRDPRRVVALHTDADLGCGLAGVLRCDLALAEAGPPLSVLSLGLVVLIGDARRLELCAAAELSECWLLEPAVGWAVRFLHPDDGRYRTRELIYPGDTVAPRRWPALSVTVLERRGAPCG